MGLEAEVCPTCRVKKKEVSEVVTQEKRKISVPQQLVEGDTRPGGSRQREELGDGEEEEEGGGQRNKKRKLDSNTGTESDTEIEAVRENLAKVENLIN